MSSGPDAVKVECGFCGTPYAWEQNVLDGNYLWVRRCKAACRREHREQKAVGWPVPNVEEDALEGAQP